MASAATPAQDRARRVKFEPKGESSHAQGPLSQALPSRKLRPSVRLMASNSLPTKHPESLPIKATTLLTSREGPVNRSEVTNTLAIWPMVRNEG